MTSPGKNLFFHSPHRQGSTTGVSVRCQRGQSTIFFLAFIVTILLSGIFLYQSGRLTSEKMELQNAADAAAYGTATLEARFMNYCAYTNRAMVGNEVAIGQIVGILSQVDQLANFGDWVHFYGELIQPVGEAIADIPLPVVPQVIGGIIMAIGEFMETGGEAWSKAVTVAETVLRYADYAVVGLFSGVNWSYGVSQELVRMTTMAASAYNLYQAIADNTLKGQVANPLDELADMIAGTSTAKGIGVSPIGMMAFGGHLLEFSSIIDEIPKLDFSGLGEGLEKKLGELLKKIFGFKVDIKKWRDLFDLEDKIFEKIGELDKLHYAPYVRRYWAVSKKEKEEKKEGEGEKKDHKHFWDDLIKDKNKEYKEEGMQHIAALVRDGRDPYTSGSDEKVHIQSKWGDIAYGKRGPQIHFDIKSNDDFFGLGDLFHFESKRGLFSSGGSELYNKNEQYAWTAMDTSNVKQVSTFEFRGILKDLVDEIKKLSSLTGCTIDIQHMIDHVLKLEEMLQLPLANGWAEAALPELGSALPGTVVKKKDVELMALWVMLYEFLGKYTEAPDGYYGDALSFTNWSSFIPSIPGAEEFEPPSIFKRMDDTKNNVIETYLGLAPYNDVPIEGATSDDPEDPPKLGFRFPFFIIGLIHNMDDITEAGPQFTGPFDITKREELGFPKNDFPPKQVSAVAKAQVYFARPEDLSYFKRNDEHYEKPNLFSPFWQARLVKSTNLDRLIFLFLQDHVVWLPKF
jgi:hypothetical protein